MPTSAMSPSNQPCGFAAYAEPASSFVERGGRYEAPGEEAGGRDAPLDQGKSDAEGDHSPGPAHRPVDPGHGEQGVQDGLPFRGGLLDQRRDEPLDRVADRLAGRERPVQLRAGPFGLSGTRSVAAAGELDGGRGEPACHRPSRPGGQPGVHRAQSAGMADQEQRRGRRGRRRRPQDAGDLVEDEVALADAAGELSLRGESHGRAFRESYRQKRSRTTYRPTVTPAGSTHVVMSVTDTTSSSLTRSRGR
ncbi:hypothetical protein SAMN05443575_0880 [Jatrophihabitans endophyticus]|uniref:Uncharacterized protein n=1 Tax=Jatrophihabitans endophyticus TaxID=1206085 RepID=A0A1M5EFI3_9ACTN|nr:hypothetical protein [Jatrophihabitans endophyticus]SHF78053.1 hypothetical protein SAMN05443575_0880 [Jatrophihabitans endophyticus]